MKGIEELIKQKVAGARLKTAAEQASTDLVAKG